MWKKLKSKKGETLIESMAALIVIVLVIAMLPTAVTAAARINATAKTMPTICSTTYDAASRTGTVDTVTITSIKDGEGNTILGMTLPQNASSKTVTGYTEDGFVYFEVG